ncbi:dnaJ homolog subfamily C member 27-like [Anneissia japonica]|uniref:dnaJ homolog subfamily C member 27-like n=1 Tax=Anneissia japonica TaxID=1529436 RepID=UPI0014257FDE|nr:dnaJ homolog subfamily C member 27-like [Anneissia japonica]XP_033095375.1 dnaJ homolog subfamily C member 27-like [Anneissia japonica]
MDCKQASEITELVKEKCEVAVSSLRWIKVIVVGNTGVGKTCLIKHFCEDKFSTGYQATIGVDYGFKTYSVNDTELRIHLWDLSGSSDYLDVRSELYHNTQIVLLVYDITNALSFTSLDNWYKEITRYSNGGALTILVANKIDLKSKRIVSIDEGLKWATAKDILYFETSASSGNGVSRMFQDVLQKLMSRTDE